MNFLKFLQFLFISISLLTGHLCSRHQETECLGCWCMSYVNLPKSVARSYSLASVGWWAESSACSVWSCSWIVTGYHAPFNVKSLSLLKFLMFDHVSI